MYLRLVLMLLACMSLCAPIHAGWWDGVMSYLGKGAATAPKIRVLIVHDKEGVSLEVKGKYKIHDAHTGEHISTRFVGKSNYLQAVRDGLKWGEEFPGIFQLVIVPDEKTTLTLVGGVQYRGPLFVYDVGGKISIVNEVSIEDFLASAMADKYKDETMKEVLAALVITARTAAYNAILHPRSPFWSVDGRLVGYQGYVTPSDETLMQSVVDDTRYMVMTTQSPDDSNKIDPFPAQWQDGIQGFVQGQQIVSKITIAEAETMVKKGAHAAQVLAKAFPGTKIAFIYDPMDKK